MQFDRVLEELEQLGEINDARQTDKSKKYLNITRDTGEFLSVLVKAIKAQYVLEIGTSNGYSTIWLADALPSRGCIFTIEHDALKIQQAKDNLDKVNLSSRVEHIQGDAEEVLEDFDHSVDFIFLDADRTQYVDLAPNLFEILKPGGLLVCDNATSHAHELESFIQWVERQDNLSTSLVPVGKGELLVYRES